MRSPVETLSLFDQPSAAPAAPAVPPEPAPAAAASLPPEPVVLALDGNGLAHRAFHGYARTSRDPLHGFAAMLCTLLEDARPDALVVGFDGPAERSHRRSRYPGYKAQRPTTDPGIHRLLTGAATWLRSCGVVVIDADGWEADDVVASAARSAEERGWRCLIASSDRDAYGAVSDGTTVLDFRGGVRQVEVITPRRLRRKPGIAPGQYLEFAALRGDSSDNLPGVPGIGPRRAALLLRSYPCVDDAVADELGLRSVLGTEHAAALLADLDDPDSAFLRNLELMTLRRDLQVDVDAGRPGEPAEVVAAACQASDVPGVASRAAVALGRG